MRLSTTYGCKQTMAYALHRLGRPEQATQIVEHEMPAIFVCREVLLPRVASPERAQRLRRSNANLFGDLLADTLDKLQYTEAAEAVRQIIGALPAAE